MARWMVAADKGVASVQSVAVLTAAAASMRRFRIMDWILGSGSTPNATIDFIHIIQRCTTAGTGAAVTPSATDQADTLASTVVAKQTITVDPTLTAGLFFAWIPLNFNATFRWIPQTYFELYAPATASNGFMFGVSAATVTSFDDTVFYEEL